MGFCVKRRERSWMIVRRGSVPVLVIVTIRVRVDVHAGRPPRRTNQGDAQQNRREAAHVSSLREVVPAACSH